MLFAYFARKKIPRKDRKDKDMQRAQRTKNNEQRTTNNKQQTHLSLPTKKDRTTGQTNTGFVQSFFLNNTLALPGC
jgi:hypothetical protein